MCNIVALGIMCIMRRKFRNVIIWCEVLVNLLFSKKNEVCVST